LLLILPLLLPVLLVIGGVATKKNSAFKFQLESDHYVISHLRTIHTEPQVIVSTRSTIGLEYYLWSRHWIDHFCYSTAIKPKDRSSSHRL